MDDPQSPPSEQQRRSMPAGRGVAAQLRVVAGLVGHALRRPPAAPAVEVRTQPHPDVRGVLIDAQPTSTVGVGGRAIPARSWRFSYTTDDSTGRVIPATGLYIRPLRPWTGPGPRPVVAFAPSTQGMGASSDPSRSAPVGWAVRRRGRRIEDVIFAYELPVINHFVSRGMGVVVIDYPRDPRTGIQLYANNIACGYALIDAVRACSSHFFPAAAPVGWWGFSQGGGAVGKACELAATAEPRPRAAVVGAPPSDLVKVLRFVDHHTLTGIVSFAVLGFYTSHPETVRAALANVSDYGLEQIRATALLSAFGAALRGGWRGSRHWTTNDQRLSASLDESAALTAELERHRLGTQPLHHPTLLWGNRYDDVIPFPQVEEVARGWVRLSPEYLDYRVYAFLPTVFHFTVGHFGTYALTMRRHAQWLCSHLYDAERKNLR
ncbi:MULTISPECIES: lipase family protein [Corynebacterium]|uniref:lipase family protein n=1 Tax=Corynebacterium TaxID=1716 RepID=UPI00178C598E|nr:MULTISPECIES: lipase family protein [Corynebacterium]